MDTLHQWAGKVYYGNELQAWAQAIGIFVLVLVVLPLARMGLDRRLRKLQPHRLDRFLDIAIEFAFWTQAAIWGARAARFMVDRRMQHVGGDQLPTLSILRFVSLLLIWSLAVLMLL
jgi:hypothetical protein